MNTLMQVSRTAILGFTLLSLAACDDPAKGKAKAVTTEATTSTTSAVAASAAPTEGTVTYAFDQSNSKVQWTGSKVTAKHEGNFNTFNGTVSLVDQAPEKSSVTVEIDADSLASSDGEQLLKHLKSADFFDVAKFPKATFTSTEIKKGGDKGATHTVTGNLTLRGVTKAITFPATIKASPTSVDVDTEFSINRKDFGIVYAGKADDLIRDDVVIKLTIRAPKKG